MNNQLVVEYQSQGYLEDADGNQHLVYLALFNGQPIYFTEAHEPMMSQSDIAEMFSIEQHTVAYHMKKGREQEIFDNSDYRIYRYTASDGKSYLVNFYSLNVIAAIGYRVKDVTPKVVRFIKWAGDVLKHHVTDDFRQQVAQLRSEVESLEETVKGEQKETREARFWDWKRDEQLRFLMADMRHDQIIDNWTD